MPFPTTPVERKDSDVLAQYGRNLINHITNRNGPKGPDSSLPRSSSQAKTTGKGNDDPVGIIGAGMAGLYTALILADLGIPFQILEASHRLGGRCYTYKFEEGGDWDYYDVGAMRFPLPKENNIGPHIRLKHLFNLLDLPLLQYEHEKDDGIMYFNGVRSTIGSYKASTVDGDKNDTFNAKELGVPDPYIAAGVRALFDDAMAPLAKLLIGDMIDHSDSGWKQVMKYDQHSTRSYLQFEYVPSNDFQSKHNIPPTIGLPTCVIDWMETFDKSSGWYDRALTETLLEAIAFGDYGISKPEWRCIRGGSSVLPKKTLEKVHEYAAKVHGMPSNLIIYDSPVTAIAPSDSNDNDDKSLVVVTARGQEYRFSHVISTVPLPNFALIDTSKLSMIVTQRNAIRQLQYGPSIKIGMLFKSPWWKKYGQVGGESFTDLPIRTIVYPSYGPSEDSNVLIASYCWTNDAERLGNLIGSGVDGVLEDLVLRDLAEVHGIGDPKFLHNELLRTYSWNWNHSAWTGGAFAFFGPGQFEYLYNALHAFAADGRLQWAGELLSIRHAWIVGALDSGWAAVYKYLGVSDQKISVLRKFYENWGKIPEWFHDTDDNHAELLLKHVRMQNPGLEMFSEMGHLGIEFEKAVLVEG